MKTAISAVREDQSVFSSRSERPYRCEAPLDSLSSDCAGWIDVLGLRSTRQITEPTEFHPPARLAPSRAGRAARDRGRDVSFSDESPDEVQAAPLPRRFGSDEGESTSHDIDPIDIAAVSLDSVVSLSHPDRSGDPHA